MSISADVGAAAEAEDFIKQVEAQEELWQAFREHPMRQGSVFIGEQ